MLEDENLLNNDFEYSNNHAVGTSILLDGANYATNLFWQPIQNANDFMPEIEEASADIIEGADLFAVKSGKSPQFGICVSHEGYKVGTNVAAIALMSTLSNYSSIVGVFKVDNGWWYVCSRNDVILSDGDMLYLDEEEAKNQLLSMLTVPDWDRKFAPAEWDIEETEEGNISEFLSQGKKIKLQKIKALRGTKLILIIIAAAICGWWLLSTLLDVFMAPTQRRVVQPIRPKPVTLAAPTIPIPWHQLNSLEDFMNNCNQGVRDMLTLMPPGWQSNKVILCTGETVATSWKQSLGLISWAEDAMRRSQFKNLHYDFDETGKALTATMTLPKIKKVSSAPLKNLKDLRHELNKTFQELGVKLDLKKKTITLRANTPNNAPQIKKSPMGKGGAIGKGKAAPNFRNMDILTFTFNSEYTPLAWLTFLTKFSGLEINSIKYNTDKKTWDYGGTFYAL